MRIKKIFITLVLLGLFFPAFSQNTKLYRDYSKGYYGMSSAEYKGSSRDWSKAKIKNFQDYKERMEGNWLQSMKNIFRVNRPCTKLSKSEQFLMWSALKEYDYHDGEIYCISIFEDVVNVSEFLGIIVLIKDNARNVDFFGYYMTPLF